MICRHIRLITVGVACLLAVGAGAVSRPDYYTAGFYTRGSDAAFYIDQGGVLDPFYIPAQQWSFVPRITLEATQNDNFFMAGDGEEAVTSIHLIPGALLIYGRPEHNHLYVDAGMGIPVYNSSAAADSGNDYMITAGGVYKTGKSQIHGRIGHRRMEGASTTYGTRIIHQDYVGDIGLEHRISTKTSLGLNGSAEIHDFGTPGYVNYNRYYGAGRFYHRMTEKSEWFVQAGIGMDDLSDSLAGVYGDAMFYDVSIGMRGKPTPKTSVSGRVGYRWRTFDDSDISDVESWIANLGVETTPFGFSTFSAELLADIRPDITRDGDSIVDKRLTLGVNRRLFTERLRGDASILGGQVEHHGPGGLSEDEYWGFNLALDWWTRWHCSVGAAYSYTERWSVTGGGPSYETGQWTLRMSWNY